MAVKERKQREKQWRRRQILDTARELLFKKGITATTMNQIARNAELSVGTLYLYFKNKGELYAALQEEGLDLLFAEISAVGDLDLPPRRKLARMALAYLDFSEQHRKYYEIFNYFLTSPEVVFAPDLKAMIDAHGSRILALIEDVLRQELAQHPPDDKALRRAALTLWSTLHGMLQLRKLQSTIMQGEDFRELYLAAAECVLAGIAAKDRESPPD